MDLSASEFRQLRGLVHQLCGLALTEEKAYLLRHRLGPLARSAGCASFAAFLAKLAGPEGAGLRDPIIEAITTAETSFFRDGHPFDAFRRVLLPRLGALVRGRRREHPPGPARVWCAGVSTGQEAYSLAMLIDDYLGAEGGPELRARDFVVRATDISARVLGVAQAGRYTGREVARGLSPAWRGRYFRPSAGGWVVDERLRGMVEFRRANLLEDGTGLGPVDLIFCRNVLIYFDESARRRVCDRFADLLRPDGLLVLGTVENLYGISTRFVSERLGPTLVYRKV
jgi:chemotaxis protein methyltransferase CheR